MNRPAADKNSRGDVFAVPQRGSVGSEAFDNQVKTLLARCFRGQIDVDSRDFGPLDSGAVVRESAVPELVIRYLLVGVRKRRIGVKFDVPPGRFRHSRR